MNILYEDNHIIAVNKPSGMLVQGDKTGDTTLLDEVKGFIKKRDDKKGNVFLGLVHRLDRPVSGVIVFAKSSKALARLNNMFQSGSKEISKIYWAIVANCPPHEQETITHYLWKDRAKNKSYAYGAPKKKSKESSLSYQLVGKSKNYYFLEIRLYTGRHHQIRCQLAKIGCPIKGDLKYGFRRSNADKSISLHARSIAFPHPVTKKTFHIFAPRENELWRFFQKN